MSSGKVLTHPLDTDFFHWVGKWNSISSLREGYLKGISVCDNITLEHNLKTKCYIVSMWKGWECTGFQWGLINEKTKEKATAAQIRNMDIVFNYLLSLYLERGLYFLNRERIVISFKIRKGFKNFWSNTGEHFFPCEIYTMAFKDSFPNTC